MICKNCGLENPDGSKFCAGCGQKIEMSPQNNAPQNNVPQNNVPQNNVPQNNVPQNNVPQSNIPQNNIPQNNNFNNQVTFDPVTGQPIMNAGKKNGIKKHLPLIIGIAGGVVAVVVAIIVVFTVIGSSGINKPLSNLEKGVENGDVDTIKECFPEFMTKDSDFTLGDDAVKVIGLLKGAKLDVNFDVLSETEITDTLSSSSSDYTWKEMIQDSYEGYKNYDGGQVEEVKQAYVKVDIDFDNSVLSAVAKYADEITDYNNKTVDVTFVKYDGDWYIHNINDAD